MKPKEQTTDLFRDAVAQAEIAEKPNGVSLLDWITDKGERDGDRIRTVSKAVRAKIASHEASQLAKTAKAVSVAAIEDVRALPPTPASLHQQYRAIMKTSPSAAGKFWIANESAIKAELSPSSFKKSN